MLQTKAPPLSRVYSISGKVFILGEYAVLAGLPALVGTLPSRFEMRATLACASEESSKGLLHPDSPAGRLMKWAEQRRLPPIQFEFQDPFQQAGGFGASTAQFAMAYLAYSRLTQSKLKEDWRSVWQLYRELTGTDLSGKAKPMPPSGADLVAQWLGGLICVAPSQTDEDAVDYGSTLEGPQLFVFSGTAQKGRKVATHEHLDRLEDTFVYPQSRWILELRQHLFLGLNAIRAQNFLELGKAFDGYANVLHAARLECPATFEDRKALRSIPGVLGVKGTGALQADGVLVIADAQAFEQVRSVASERNLNLLSQGLPHQEGVQCLN